MNLDEYKHKFDPEESTPGWDAIDACLKPIYGDVAPKHFGTVISYRLGGPDPIDGISIYESELGGIPHKHVITYGFSNLYYDEEAVGKEFSGFGFELSFRIIPEATDDDMTWCCNLIQNIARYVFQSGKYFDDYHYIPANGPIKYDSDTQIRALCFVTDPELGVLHTPHGEVKMLQMVGITQAEVDDLIAQKSDAESLLKHLKVGNPYWITDLARRD